MGSNPVSPTTKDFFRGSRIIYYNTNRSYRGSRSAGCMKRGSRAWKKQGNQRWKWRKKKLRRRKASRKRAKQ
ncbi:MAG: hypothetical protein CMA98_02345 [Euryarchaeota archaeon]|nr:hypothetical protein [Euryarchaeota archaeon]